MRQPLVLLVAFAFLTKTASGQTFARELDVIVSRHAQECTVGILVGSDELTVLDSLALDGAVLTAELSREFTQLGSGCLISADGLVATARHILPLEARIDDSIPRPPLFVKYLDNEGVPKLYYARFVASGVRNSPTGVIESRHIPPEEDLALLSLVPDGFRCLQLATFSRPGDVVWSCGWVQELPDLDLANLTFGYLNKKSSETGLLYHSAPIETGFSGGPVVNSAGFLVAMNVLTYGLNTAVSLGTEGIYPVLEGYLSADPFYEFMTPQDIRLPARMYDLRALDSETVLGLCQSWPVDSFFDEEDSLREELYLLETPPGLVVDYGHWMVSVKFSHYSLGIPLDSDLPNINIKPKSDLERIALAVAFGSESEQIDDYSFTRTLEDYKRDPDNWQAELVTIKTVTEDDGDPMLFRRGEYVIVEIKTNEGPERDPSTRVNPKEALAFSRFRRLMVFPSGYYFDVSFHCTGQPMIPLNRQVLEERGGFVSSAAYPLADSDEKSDFRDSSLVELYIMNTFQPLIALE
jgi:hypothetical protein